MFEFTFGDIGSGKSLHQAETVIRLLRRSRKIQKKYHLPLREVWCNFHMNEKIREANKDRLFYWQLPQQMIFEDYPTNRRIRRNFDLVWDEMAVELPSDAWRDTDPAIRRFFAQHRKRGVQIFGNTQDYMMLDINARRMATKVYETHKILGNRDPSSTLPPVKLIWGVIIIWQLDKRLIREDAGNKKHLDLIPEFLFITKKLTEAYDTTEDIAKNPKLKLQHVEYWCDTCKGIKKIEHIPI
jgi:hypothetical protein